MTVAIKLRRLLLGKKAMKNLDSILKSRDTTLPTKGCIVKAVVFLGFPGGSDGRESACNAGRYRFEPWVRKIFWRREWPSTPVFLPGEFHGQRNLAGYSPWGCKELDKIE